MSNTAQTDILIYRVRENGLEVFLLHQEQPLGEDALPSSVPTTHAHEHLTAKFIALDPVMDADGTERNAIAIEADWHEIPSLRALIYEDYRVAKEKAKQHLKNILLPHEGGAYVAVKEAFKRVLPAQYAFLKELKDIVSDKNQTKYI